MTVASHNHRDPRIEAQKTIGPMVFLTPLDFKELLHKMDKPLVISSEQGVFRTRYLYLLNYRGFFFHCRDKNPLTLPTHCHVIKAKKIWIPH
ncbi:MAG: hypothetical protein EA411_13150 [Saprospirales bacterium]|nr:MAG: hypothetical protein EA411_13150 [Saprospirales bacterium]